jgi:DNA polymerase-3 subunit gamma/tau
VDGLELGGVASELARNCELGSWDRRRLVLTLDPASARLRVEAAEQRLRGALTKSLGEGVEVEIRISRPEGETPSQRRRRQQAERLAAAEAAMAADPVVEAMQQELGARIVPGSVVAPSDGPLPTGGGIHEHEVSKQ